MYYLKVLCVFIVLFASSSAALNFGDGRIGRSWNKGAAATGILRALRASRMYGGMRASFAKLISEKVMRENARNCWLHALNSSGLKFQLSCNDDGKFSPKQCTNNRCWCVNDVGKRIRRGGDDGFYNGRKEGLKLKCTMKRT